MRPTFLALLALATLLGACSPQGDCAHSYGTPNVSFDCRGGRFEVTCVGTNPAQSAAPPYVCTCRSPDGATRTFRRDTELWTYHGSSDFSDGYAAVNAGCGWQLED